MAFVGSSPRRGEVCHHVTRARGRRRHERAEHGGRRVGGSSERVGRLGPVGREGGDLGGLAPVDVGDRDPVVRPPSATTVAPPGRTQ